MKNIIFILSLLFFSSIGFAQSHANYKASDTIRGKLHQYRRCFDVTFYDLDIAVDPSTRSISGSNTIHYKVTEDFKKIQLDLFRNMEIHSVEFKGKKLPFKRVEDAFMIEFKKTQKAGKKGIIKVNYSGKPRVAKMPPWDGGFSWEKNNGKDWIGVSCEGIGASLWWPCKDHLSDEPESMRITCEVPKGLTCVSNGRLKKTTEKATTTKFEWFVSYPINNYNVTLNIADYAHWHDTYKSPKGDTLSLDYYVLKKNLEASKKQFSQVKPMLKAYEELFGKYPFWNDGYKLVHTSYLGMEHQGAIAYGNGFKNGYQGRDLSGSTVGMLFDYIIIHESGHEYWGNSVSCKDHAEMWIHESWCTYTESLYIEKVFGKEKAFKYLDGYRKQIANRKPMLAPLDFNASAPGDIYFKGALMLHTFRNAIDDDKKWFDLLYKISQQFKYKTISSQELIEYINKTLGKNWSPFFAHYLKRANIPTLQLQKKDDVWRYKWHKVVSDFEMPIKALADGKLKIINPSHEWQSIQGIKDLKIMDKLYYINIKTL